MARLAKSTDNDAVIVAHEKGARPHVRHAAPTAIRSVAFVSLGCPKNLVDSERMLGLLAADGLTVTSDAASADAIVINTCGFLEASKEESLREIHDAIELKKSGKCKRVVVAGCLVQRHKTRLLEDAPGIDRLVGVFDREHIVEAVQGRANSRQEHGHYLGKYHSLKVVSRQWPVASEGNAGRDHSVDSPTTSQSPVDIFGPLLATDNRPLATTFEDDRARLRLTPRHFAYLRVSEGCNQGCTFCTIPSIRGPMRSKPVEQILAEARELAADGAVELNLIGQDTTSYGTDIGYAPGLSGLLSALDRELKDVRWLRLMYAYPSCFTDDMIKTIADRDRVVKYIDMPLQHISDRILTGMRRRVTRSQIETLLDKLRRWVPGIAVRTTFISGSPGETEAEHQELVRFVKDFGFEMMGVFPYSQEKGTAMGRMEAQLPEAVKQQRVEELMLTQQEVAFSKADRMRGQIIEVMVERQATSNNSGGYVARGQSQAPDIDSTTLIRWTRDCKPLRLHPGQFLNVKVAGSEAYDLIAEVPRVRSRKLDVVSA